MSTGARRRPELLAPAGDMDALRAALLAGADAVYVGGRRFGARAFATNFDRAALGRARRATRRLGRRLYVTFNTLVFDREWAAVEDELDFLEELAPDALIVQDLGVLETLRQRGSGIPRHLSTQGAWDGAGGADLLASLGVSRVILPRETPLGDIAGLAAGPFEIETFVHGAHCYSVSGRCWWSAALGSRSGNRGTCAQPCRRTYDRGDGGDAPLFSPKDLRLVDRLQELAAAGVASLKIEGRLKDASYVARVVGVYREALDAGAPPRQAHGALDAVFGRSACEGFLDGPPRGWRTGAVVGALGASVARVTGAPDREGRVPVALSAPLAAGDGVAWLAGAERQGDRVTWVGRLGAGRDAVRLRRGAPPPIGATLHRTAAARDDDPTVGWDPAWERPEVTLRFGGAVGAPLTCSWDVGGDDGEGARGTVATARPLEPARGAGLETLLPDRFRTLGPDAGDVTIDATALAPGLFLPPSELKALRRAVVEALFSAPERAGRGRRLARSPCRTGITAEDAENAESGRAESIWMKGQRTKSASHLVPPRVDPLCPPSSLRWELRRSIPQKSAGGRCRRLAGPSATASGGTRSQPSAPLEVVGPAIRLWQADALGDLRHLRPAGGWILPATAGPAFADGLDGPIGWWLPPAFGPGAADRLAPLVTRLVAAAPPSRIVCLSWEAFDLAPRFPAHAFWLDGTFNVANERALAVIRAVGLDAVASPEAPPVFRAASRTIAVNPLVSLSRFPPDPSDVGRTQRNPHGDRFHLEALAVGVWGLFLERVPAVSVRPDGVAWIDVWLPRRERATVVERVERLLVTG